MKFSVLVLFLSAMFMSLCIADDALPAKAKVNVNGQVYLGMVPVDDDGMPNPAGPHEAPTMIVFAQEMDRLWGGLVSVIVNDDGPGLAELQLIQLPIEQGKVKKKNLAFNVPFSDDEATITWQMSGAIAADGTFTARIETLFGPITNVIFKRQNEPDKPVSGFYIGKAWRTGTGRPGVNNLVVFFMMEGSSMSGMTLFFLPEEPNGVLLNLKNGTYTKATDSVRYSLHEDGMDIDASGNISAGRLTMVSTTSGVDYDVEAWYMNDRAWTTPKLSKPKPKRFSPGEQTEVLVPQQYMASGCVPTLVLQKVRYAGAPAGKRTTADVWIDKAGFDNNGNIRLLINSVADLNLATFKLEFRNLSGKSALSKRFKIK